MEIKEEKRKEEVWGGEAGSRPPLLPPPYSLLPPFSSMDS